MNSYHFNAPRQTILIVDDAADNLSLLSRLLTEHGYQVRCAKNGSMALIGANTAPPDLILLDIKMPDMNGYEVCQKLKASLATRDIPVIFLSALDDVLDKVTAFDVGGVDYITKPFQVKELLARVKSQLALQAAKAEIYKLNAELEQRVEQRTTQLQATNLELQGEIAERMLAEKLLQESEERLESILNSLEEVVWSISAQDKKLLYLNPAAQKVYGRSISEFFENPNLRLKVVHPEDRKQVEMSIQTLLSQNSVEVEYRILRPDGEVRWLSDKSRMIYNENGVAIRLDGIIEDITERKRVEEEIRSALEKEKELSELKSRFVTMTSHEFRTPLSTILSSSELLQDYSFKWSEEKKLKHFQRIGSAVKHMTDLLNDVLLISKAEAGKLECNPTPLDLAQFCGAMVEEIQISTDIHTIAFCTHNPCPCAYMDEKLLRHILSNLLSNAIKYSPRGGTVQFDLVCEQGKAIFHIQDEGIGIPKEDQPQLFNSFHRARNVGTISGTGLGLAIVKKSVDLHGGKIQVLSEAGVGTTFTVILPNDSRVAVF